MDWKPNSISRLCVKVVDLQFSIERSRIISCSSSFLMAIRHSNRQDKVLIFIFPDLFLSANVLSFPQTFSITNSVVSVLSVWSRTKWVCWSAWSIRNSDSSSRKL